MALVGLGMEHMGGARIAARLLVVAARESRLLWHYAADRYAEPAGD
jgi:hypothetical protein